MEIKVDALVDFRALASFINVNFVKTYGLPIKLRNTLVQVGIVDGRTIGSIIVIYKIAIKFENK